MLIIPPKFVIKELRPVSLIALYKDQAELPKSNGIPTRKLNLNAVYFSIPTKTPVKVVIADLEVPGINANI